MQSSYPEWFAREMTCNEAEWHRWLPQALGSQTWTMHRDAVDVHLGTGALALSWSVGEPRVIGLARLPRLHVSFRFAGVDGAQRHAFMRRFDLYMQRGGG
jgi:hypothetical protein